MNFYMNSIDELPRTKDEIYDSIKSILYHTYNAIESTADVDVRNIMYDVTFNPIYAATYFSTNDVIRNFLNEL